ncbi:hypothetical protein RDABS01_009972 [Bienertia sinuspersici]
MLGILRTGLEYDTFLWNRLIDLYSKCNNSKYGFQVFDVMPQRDSFSWNSVMHAYCLRKCLREMLSLGNNMISAFVRNSDHGKALEIACGALLDIDFGRFCHGFAIKVGADQNIYVGNALLSMYARCKCIGMQFMLFKELPTPNVVSFNGN